MKQLPLSPYATPALHKAVSDIIRAHSHNPLDVRTTILRGLDLSGAESVLDLGCGFGFMAEAIAARIAPGGMITGVDACDSNRRPFLRRVGSTDRKARFVRQQLNGALPCRRESFDAVIASYSLYFFADLIPDIARVLRPGGVFVTVTHSPTSFRGLLAAIGLTPEEAGIHRLIRNFSAENGERMLAPAFGDVQRVDYPNRLCFERHDMECFLAYLRFKLPFVLEGRDAEGSDRTAETERLVEIAAGALERDGEIVIEKDDTAFICRQPRPA